MGKGSNSSGLRRYNERVLLTALRKAGTASKSDLARLTNLTPQAVTRIVDELESTGMVMREGRRLGGKGQPSIMYTINPTGAYSIGIKVGRRNVELLLMDFGGNILKKICQEFECPEPDFLLRNIESGIENLSAELVKKDQSKLVGVGIAMPWFIGAWTKELEMSDTLANEWREINFAEEVSKGTHLPVFFENDCSAAAVAELQFGKGTEVSDFLYIFVGTFIGGGLVLNSSLETGVHGNSGNLATMPVPASKLSSTPEPEGAFETLLNRASLFGLRRHLRANQININDSADLLSVMDQARPLIQEWLDDCADALVYAILSAVSVLDLEAVVIDAHLPRFLLEELVEIISRRMQQAAPSGVFKPQIMSGKIGIDAIAIGGAILPFYSNFAPDKTVLLKGGVPERVPV
ncbi:ROK family transcriptional regulator [Microbulbifer sp. PSTR4-B]|uniref:ROK family transcriptional regulator n=1 Tax=Microbulbifer sp. PSTR4-B TaxID=3243396 RepID=UPI004039B6F2